MDDARKAEFMYTAIMRYCNVEGPDRTYAERRCNYEELSAVRLLAEGREIPAILQPALNRLTEIVDATNKRLEAVCVCGVSKSEHALAGCERWETRL